MRRVRRRFVLVYLIFNFVWISSVTADCYFENKTHQENQEVPTSEPCLNCTCKHGALVCYLRICTELPDPPPAGCIVLHRHRSCCPELICTDKQPTPDIEGRSDTEGLEDFNLTLSLENACIDNGTVYSPGSAMGSSSVCEYCYCIGGQQTCIKPKCLLNLEGCTPKFEHRSCCPIRYNCTGYFENNLSSTTQRTPTKEPMVRGGCIVSGTYYSEGSRVLGIGHSACDNCYCLRGVLRCEPLSCAPDILGCTPVIKLGECCAASYSCNGTIEVQPKPNYGKFPVISKEYAKLSTETQWRRPLTKLDKPLNNTSNLTYYVLAEPSNTASTKMHRDYGTTRHIIDPSTTGPKYKFNTLMSTKDIDLILDMRTRPSTAFRKSTYETTDYKHEESTNTISRSTENKLYKSSEDQTSTTKATFYTNKDNLEKDVIQSPVDSLFDAEENNTKMINILSSNASLNSSTSDYMSTTEDEIANGYALNLTNVISTLLSTLADFSTTTYNEEANITFTTTTKNEDMDANTKIYENSSVSITTDKTSNRSVTLLKTKECLVTNKSENLTQKTTDVLNEVKDDLVLNSTTEQVVGVTKNGLISQTTTSKDITVVDLESRVKVDNITLSPLRKIPSDIETILNLTVNIDKDYADYDYNDPNLPPSLPNLRIIPFVAADALDSKVQGNQNNVDYLSNNDRMDVELPTYNLFSPPTKTEGGFVPKAPSIFNNLYHTPLSNVHITTIGPVRTHENNCIAEEREIKHGETVKAESCIMCVCIYGNVVCQHPQCSQPTTGCKLLNDKNSACCPKLECESEMVPVNIVDHSTIVSTPRSIITLANNVSNSSSFDNHMGTTAVPNLYSFNESSTTIPTTIATTIQVTETKQSSNSSFTSEEFSFNKVWNFLFNAETTTAKQAKLANSSKINNTLANDHTSVTTSATTPTTNMASLVTNLQHKEDTSITVSHETDSTAGLGILKLAGCNIYGRMYRVGKIISELSGPCQECKCSEIGVQCLPLKC